MPNKPAPGSFGEWVAARERNPLAPLGVLGAGTLIPGPWLTPPSVPSTAQGPEVQPTQLYPDPQYANPSGTGAPVPSRIEGGQYPPDSNVSDIPVVYPGNLTLDDLTAEERQGLGQAIGGQLSPGEQAQFEALKTEGGSEAPVEELLTPGQRAAIDLQYPDTSNRPAVDPNAPDAPVLELQPPEVTGKEAPSLKGGGGDPLAPDEAVGLTSARPSVLGPGVQTEQGYEPGLDPDLRNSGPEGGLSGSFGALAAGKAAVDALDEWTRAQVGDPTFSSARTVEDIARGAASDVNEATTALMQAAGGGESHEPGGSDMSGAGAFAPEPGAVTAAETRSAETGEVPGSFRPSSVPTRDDPSESQQAAPAPPAPSSGGGHAPAPQPAPQPTRSAPAPEQPQPEPYRPASDPAPDEPSRPSSDPVPDAPYQPSPDPTPDAPAPEYNPPPAPEYNPPPEVPAPPPDRTVPDPRGPYTPDYVPTYNTSMSGNEGLDTGGGIEGGGCFAAGTPIRMADGSERPIEQIAPGDKVLAYDETTRELQPAIVHTLHHHLRCRVYALVIDGRPDIVTTAEHRFFVDGTWRTIAQLGNGIHHFLTYDPERKRVVARRWRDTISLAETRDVYNLSLDTVWTFFARGVLAHNTKDRFGGELAFGERDFFS